MNQPSILPIIKQEDPRQGARIRFTPPRGYEAFSLMTWPMGDAHRCTRARHGCEERGATARVAVEGSFPFWKPHADNTLTTRTTAMSRGRKHGPSASGGPRVHLNDPPTSPMHLLCVVVWGPLHRWGRV